MVVFDWVPLDEVDDELLLELLPLPELSTGVLATMFEPESTIGRVDPVLFGRVTGVVPPVVVGSVTGDVVEPVLVGVVEAGGLLT